MITVLGKLKDTLKYIGVDGYNVLPDSPDWTLGKNRQWLLKAIGRGDHFLLVSLEVSGQYATELQWLLAQLTTQ